MYLRLTLLAAATLSIVACSPSNTPAASEQNGNSAAGKTAEISGMVSTDGSSTVFPVTEAMAEEFQKENAGINVTVGMSGTGGGFKKFCRGETDISNASRPIKGEEKEACKAAGVEYIELPVAIDALTVVVNPQNTWANDLTVDELKAMWVPVNRPGFRRHLAAINYGLGGGGYEHEALHG